MIYLHPQLYNQFLYQVKNHIHLLILLKVLVRRSQQLQAIKYHFAENNKVYKANPDLYLGNVGDVAEILRITLTSNRNSPNLYSVMKILNHEEVCKRVIYVVEKILH